MYGCVLLVISTNMYIVIDVAESIPGILITLYVKITTQLS